MASESTQHKLDRIRPPRVQITYDVETGGAIDRDNFNDVMNAIGPRLAIRVPNRLQADGDPLNVELKFHNIDDFDPVALIGQVPALAKLYEGRKRLRDLLTKLDGNDELDSLLKQVVESTETRAALRQDLAAPDAAPAPEAAATAETAPAPEGGDAPAAS